MAFSAKGESGGACCRSRAPAGSSNVHGNRDGAEQQLATTQSKSARHKQRPAIAGEALEPTSAHPRGLGRVAIAACNAARTGCVRPREHKSPRPQRRAKDGTRGGENGRMSQRTTTTTTHTTTQLGDAALLDSSAVKDTSLALSGCDEARHAVNLVTEFVGLFAFTRWWARALPSAATWRACPIPWA